MKLADGYRLALTTAARASRPDPELHVDEWAEQHMILPTEAAESGRYRISRTPMARRIMQTLSPRHPARRVVVRGASQMLKTQVAINFLAASAHLAPANMLVLEPTDSLAKRLSARFSKTIRDVRALRGVFAPPRSRDSRNTVFAKDFAGGTMYIATAGSAANLAEIPARYVVIDEVDRLEVSVGGEGDPVDLAEARATTFEASAKFLEVSSPTTVGASKIDVLYEMGTQEVYLVPCPHCSHHHELRLENYRYDADPRSGRVRRAWFSCPECGADIDERDKPAMLRDAALGGTAHWHARSEGDGETVSFHVSAFYAPSGSVSWLALARQHLKAKARLERGDPEAMQVFYNTRLALSWENTLERTTAQDLRDRAEPYPPRIVPDRALVVTIAVDTQANRLEVQAEAWGPDLEHWVLDHQVFIGNPSAPPTDADSVWRKLDEYRAQPFQHSAGGLIYASCYGIDSGGSNTQDVYNYGAGRQQLGCVILHGSSKPGRPIISSAPAKVDIDWQGNRRPGGALLWSIGTDVAKDHLHNRIKVTSGGGAMHWHDRLPVEWFEQFLAERPVLVRKPGGGFKRVWAKANAGDRNEALDLSVYNLAMAHHLGLHKWAPADWERLRARLVPPVVAPAMPAQTAAPAVTPPAPAPRPAPPPVGRRILNRGF